MSIADDHRVRQWSFQCTCCDYTFRTTARTRIAAQTAAYTNGWLLSPAPRCPGCLTARACMHISQSSTPGAA